MQVVTGAKPLAPPGLPDMLVSPGDEAPAIWLGLQGQACSQLAAKGR